MEKTVAEKIICRKRRFADQLAAGRFMIAMHFAGKAAGNTNTYYCGVCSSWHWGHTIPSRKKTSP